MFEQLSNILATFFLELKRKVNTFLHAIKTVCNRGNIHIVHTTKGQSNRGTCLAKYNPIL